MRKLVASSISAFAGAALASAPTPAAAQRDTAPLARISPEIGGDCTGCELSRRVLVGWSLDDGSFDKADFTMSDLSRASLARGALEGANFTNVTAEGADFSSADLGEAVFILARARGADFRNADLRGANFTLAKLERARFNRANVAGAFFDRAQLSGADFSEVQGLTQEQLRFACGDDETRLPASLSIPSCED